LNKILHQFGSLKLRGTQKTLPPNAAIKTAKQNHFQWRASEGNSNPLLKKVEA